MQHASCLTSSRSSALHRRSTFLGRLLSSLRAPLLRCAPVLLFASIGSTATAAAPLPLMLTAVHFQYGLDYPELGSFPQGFDHLHWTANKAGATRFTIKYRAKSLDYTFTLPLGGNPRSAEMPRATAGTLAVGVYPITYHVEGYKGSTLVSISNDAVCGEMVRNGGFSPNPGFYWEQDSTNHIGRGSFLQDTYAQLGGVDSVQDTISTLCAYDVPNARASSTQFRQLELSCKVRCDTTDVTDRLYDSLIAVISDLRTGVQLYTSPVICSNMTAGEWFEFVEDLPYDQFAGKALRLTFVASTDESLPTAFYIRDVTLNVSISYK